MRLLYVVDSFLGLNQNQVTILCYHSISKKHNKYAVGLTRFKQEIERILRYAKFVSIEEMIEAKVAGPIVVLTIDDGYEDVMGILPITQSYRIPVSLFVLSHPQKANRKELDHGGKLLTMKQIKSLVAKGWTIGGHSATHADFLKLGASEIQKEIVDSKSELERKLGIKIKYFSYPKGVYTQKIIRAVKRAGYKAAFAVAPSHVGKKANLLTLPRVVIDASFEARDLPALYSFSTLALRRLMGKWGLTAILPVL
ncbi:MAG: polysaccharide deacetylase family protein [Candidatus Chisholmbacteria bacterium]|nr:polysaccharide deacetylase family protein [Candidatus Chisholmbacteria bacterium]